jgi:hypothetical protein
LSHTLPTNITYFLSYIWDTVHAHKLEQIHS